jgi:hypothetical protein
LIYTVLVCGHDGVWVWSYGGVYEHGGRVYVLIHAKSNVYIYTHIYM